MLWLYTFLLLSSLSFVGISENERKSLYLMVIISRFRDQNAGLLRFGLDGIIVPEEKYIYYRFVCIQDAILQLTGIRVGQQQQQ